MYRIPTQFTVFSSDAERQQARAALSDLHVALQDFRDYETKGLQKTLALSEPTAGAISITVASDDSSGDAAIDSNADANSHRDMAVDRVTEETEALGSLLSLTAHPDTFPAPLRDEVGQVSRELHTYLQDVRYAVALPTERSRLLSLASQHLSQGESLLHDMEGLVGGLSTGASVP
jgi:hypothetical protein